MPTSSWLVPTSALFAYLLASVYANAIARLRASDADADSSGRVAAVLSNRANYQAFLRLIATAVVLLFAWSGSSGLLHWLSSRASTAGLFGSTTYGLNASSATVFLGLLASIAVTDRVSAELGRRWALGLVRSGALPLALGLRLSRPILALLDLLSRAMRKPVDGSADSNAPHPPAEEEDIRRLLASAEQSQLSEQKRELLDNIFELSERVARQVMVPRADVVSLDINRDASRNIQIARETGHTRFPLCDGDLDNILGFIHIKDLFRRGSAPDDLLSMKRETFFVPETLPLEKLMRRMRSTHVHMAPIVDEYGNVSGIVTFENVIEEIVGEIQDEFDAERPELVRSSDGTFQVLGSMLIADLEDQLTIDLENEEDDTIGGVVLSAIGRSPEVGDRIRVGPLDLEVLEVDVNRIRSLRLRRTEASHSAPPP